jgi:hypothetical protein
MYIKDIQKKYNISYERVRKILEQAEVYKKSHTLTYSEETLNYIKENYHTLSNKEISTHLNINEDHLRVVALKLNLPKKGSGWKYNENLEKIDFNSNIFNYYLGWLASDGNISKDYRTVKLSITDEEIVNNFQKYFKTGSIYTEKKGKNLKQLYIFCISSKKFAKKISDKGITPNKSLTLKVKEEIVTPEFIRGVFEGDGHVRSTLNIRGKKRFEAGFVSGSRDFALQIKSFLDKNGINSIFYQEDLNTYRLRISGRENLKLFYEILYKNCDGWFLKRKKQVLDLLFSNE